MSQDSIQYSADTLFYNREDTVITLLGNSQISYDDVVLTADTVQYNLKTRILLSFGNSVMINGKDTLYGDYIAYNLKTKQGKVKIGTVYTNDKLIYKGERIARGVDGNIYIDNGSYTTSTSLDSSHYFFYGKKIKVIPQDKSIVQPLVLDIENSPVATLPFIVAPLGHDRKNGFLTPQWRVGINGSGSVDNIGYYWAFNDYVDLAAAGKIDNFNEYLIKGKTNYAVKNKLSGSFYGEYSLNQEYGSEAKRWKINFRHNQYLLPDNSLTLKGSGDLVSDKNFNKDYSEDTTELLNQDLSADISLTKRFNKLGGYATVNWNRKQNLQKETINQSLPSVRFTLNQRALIPNKGDSEDDKWFNKIRWSYTAQANQRLETRNIPDSSYNRKFRGFSQSLPISAPFEVFKYLKITPNISLNQSIFDAYSDTTTKDTVTVYDTIYQTMPISKLKEVDVIEDIANGTIVIVDTLYPPEVEDTIVRYNSEIKSRNAIIQDTTYWWEDDFSWEKASNFWWNTGVSFSTNLYGTFPVKIGNLTGLRHTLTPSISYNYIPKKDLDVIFPTSVGIRSPRGTKKQQRISLSLNNLLESRTQRGDKTKKQRLLTFDVRGSYDFEAEEKKLSNIAMSASIPTSFVDLSYSGTLSPYDNDNTITVPKGLSQSITVNPRLPTIKGDIWSGDFFSLENVADKHYLDGLALTNKTGWSIRLSPRYNMSLRRNSISEPYTKKSTYNLGSSVKFNFSHRWSINWRGDWSFNTGTFVNQSVSLFADLESWELKFDWYPTGINSGRFYFRVDIKKHKDVQWEKRNL